MDLLEQVFTLDSSLTSAIIAAQHARLLTLDPLAVAVFTLDHCVAFWELDMQQRLHWTSMLTEKYAFRKEFYTRRKSYSALLSQHSQLDSSLTEERERLSTLLTSAAAPLGSLAREVRQLAEEGKLWVTESALLSSLAHMHINRLLGIDPVRERKIYAFWHHTVDALRMKP